jgi:hypothetical protein
MYYTLNPNAPGIAYTSDGNKVLNLSCQTEVTIREMETNAEIEIVVNASSLKLEFPKCHIKTLDFGTIGVERIFDPTATVGKLNGTTQS